MSITKCCRIDSDSELFSHVRLPISRLSKCPLSEDERAQVVNFIIIIIILSVRNKTQHCIWILDYREQFLFDLLHHCGSKHVSCDSLSRLRPVNE